MKRLYKYLPLILLVLCIGCNRNLPLSGTVTFSDDGTPVPCGHVLFDDGTYSAKAPIAENGTYTVTFGTRKGIPRGTYKVRIAGAVQKGEKKLQKNKMTGKMEETMASQQVIQLVHPKYAKTATTDLTFTADGSTSVYDIKVDRPGKK